MNTHEAPRFATSWWVLACVAALSGPSPAWSETPVRYTEAVEREVPRSVRLPGSVESYTSSVVASEVSGLVVAMEAREGDRVEVGQPLVRLRPRWYELQLTEARGRLQEAEARIELAQSKLARARELFADEVVSEQDLDDAVSEFTAWEGRVSQSRAEVERVEFSVERLVISAPFDGVVVRKLIDLGEWVELGGAVVEMVAMNELEVRLEVPERYYRDLHPGVRAAIGFEAIPDLVVDGRVAAIIPRADPQARTFPIKVALPATGGRVGVGMVARVDLPIGDRATAVIVPKDAVVRQGPDETVYRINGQNQVEPLTVRTGQGLGAWIVVNGPVQAGDRIVTRGNERLQPGQVVEGSSLEYALP
jgi:RND family efflux transporter MFP subunit